MAQDEEDKGGLFGKLKGAMGQALGVPGSGAVPPQGPQGARRPAAKTGGDSFRNSTQPLAPAPRTKPLAPEAPARPLGPSEEELSPRRLAMIEDYLRGDFKIEQMRDPAYMYKVVADERAHQTRRLLALRKQLAGAKGEQAEKVQAQIKRAQTTVQNLFRVLKRITGKEGRTGGTDFLHGGKEPPPP